MPVFFSLPAVVSGLKLEVASSVPVVVNSVYSANNVNAGKIASSEQRSVVDAGIYSHSGSAAAEVQKPVRLSHTPADAQLVSHSQGRRHSATIEGGGG